jgi:tripartite-type tricarboxylate transporter receptor subunit TctC
VPVLQRVRLFWMHTGVAAERRKYLEDACEAAYNTKEYQDFNKRKYMHLARSFYKGDEAMALVSELVDAYTMLYKKTGLLK